MLDHHVALGRLARLAGAQHDAQAAVAQLLADFAHQAQARVVGLHHHVEQHQRDVAVAGQHAARLGARMRVQEAELPALEHEIGQRHGGDLVHFVFIVGNQDLPVLPPALTLVFSLGSKGKIVQHAILDRVARISVTAEASLWVGLYAGKPG